MLFPDETFQSATFQSATFQSATFLVARPPELLALCYAVAGYLERRISAQLLQVPRRVYHWRGFVFTFYSTQISRQGKIWGWGGGDIFFVFFGWHLLFLVILLNICSSFTCNFKATAETYVKLSCSLLHLRSDPFIVEHSADLMNRKSFLKVSKFEGSWTKE